MMKYSADLIELITPGPIFEGNIKDIANLTKLTFIYLNNESQVSKVTGDIDEFARAQVAAGRVSGTIDISCCTNITYQGEKQESGA